MALLERVGLAGREKERVAGYSKGMKQRLMLARALVNTPRLLFLDEPTDGLDPVSSRTIHTLIREAAARGATVFLTTHDMVEADKLSNRVAFINQGRIVALDTPVALKRQYGQRALEDRGGAEPMAPPRSARCRSTRPRPRRRSSIFSAASGSLTVHSEEATLEEIFRDLTGRGLVG